ncbi:LysR family transcriptional regulator [Sphingosinicella sp. CPCC 101087]|uniref:LysR family transcriptional regulator n=1 Tax=Sphingosinicella sp. CPCC 101087 TaxID=2497754 RepID=UPI00101B9CA1|nr:LysR family transcriptional regulator [Sphingosinicella sp. CPCC 101087]
MDWDDLRFFLAVAQLGQLSRAAARLGVDSTTVGRRIRRLENALQQTLFEQTREGQALTEAGERLLLVVEEMDHSAARIQAAPAGDRVSGLIRVSVSEGFGTWFVAHHLRSFVERHPGAQVDLVASSGFLSPSRRETDVAILLARPRKGPLVSQKLSDYALGLYASRAYLARQDAAIDDVASLRTHPLIGYIPHFIYAPELRYLNEIAPELELRIRSSSINAQYRATAAGAGVAILPCFMGDADPELVRIVPRVRIERSFWLVTHEENRRLARIEAFVDWLISTVGRHRERLLGLEVRESEGPRPD